MGLHTLVIYFLHKDDTEQTYFPCFQAGYAWQASISTTVAYNRGFNTVTDVDSEGRTYKIYKCVDCIYTTKWFSTIKRHSATHEDPQIPCSLCGAKFCTTNSLNAHMTGFHKLPTTRCRCIHCSASYSTVGLLRNHLRKTHLLAEKDWRFQCEKCSIIFDQGLQLQAHWACHQHDWTVISSGFSIHVRFYTPPLGERRF